MTTFVSVIMPVRNEGSFIEHSLRAVLTQNYPPDCMEILIADGISNDSTRAVIARTTAEYPKISVTVLDNPGHIVATGLNIALAHTRGEIVIRVDGHCLIAPDYVSQCVAHLQSGDYDGVGGPTETIGSTPLSETIALAMSSPFGVGDSTFRVAGNTATLADTIPFPAYTRQALEKVGPYDEELVRNQDDEYNYRIRELGGRIFLSPDIRSRYYSRSSIRSLWRQYFQYGYYKVRVMQKHPRQMRPRQFVPPLFVAVLGIGGLCAPFAPAIRYVWLSVIALYALATVGVSLIIASRHGRRHLWVLPTAFATLHFSYGLGFLLGLIKFAGRWQRKHGT